jgi:hypothetical protein
MMMTMNKYQRLEEELHDIYAILSPEQIRRIIENALKEKINHITSDKNDNSYGKYQENLIATCLDVNPLAYLLGYIDTLEDIVSEQNPYIMEEIVIDPQVKADLAKNYEKHNARIFFDVVGAVNPMGIRNLIETAQENDLSMEDFIISLEALMEEAWNKP